MNDPDLHHPPFLDHLLPDSQSAVQSRLIPRLIPSGQTLLIENDPAEFAYFIRSGVLRAIRMNPDGRIQVLARFTPPDPVNFISLLTPPRRNRATIEALSDAELLALSAADFDTLIANYSDFSALLLQQLAGRISALTDKIASLSLYPVRTRLARFILQLADGAPASANGWTQDEIAAEIGTTRDIVGRVLREFEQEELILRNHSEILLLNKARLYEIAEITLT